MKRLALILALLLPLLASAEKRAEDLSSLSYAWRTLPPLGLHEAATIDTTLHNYYLQAVPSDISSAYATTGNYGAEGQNQIYFERPTMTQFFFRDGLRHWLPSEDTHKYYNTRVPMTLLSYNTGGSRDNNQDHLKMIFSGNANEKLQIGANFSYLYSKGMYDNQAAKNLIWGGSASYMGDRWELQAYYNHWNSLNKENGGITDDLYITDPAEVQGGQTSVNVKTIPTRLSAAHTRLVGGELYLNNRYKIGYWKEEQVDDTTTKKTYVPFTCIIWTLKYNQDKHLFYNEDQSEAREFWKNSYLDAASTRDRTGAWSLTNTVGLSLIEGFHKWAKFGLAAYVTHQFRKFNQTADTLAISGDDRPAGLTPYPFATRMKGSVGENLMWVGAQLTKQQGSLLTYEATGEIGFVGPAAGEIKAEGKVNTSFKLFGDTARVSAYGLFRNETAPFFMNHYISNHFAWENDFGKTRRLRFGGEILLGKTGTYLNVGMENVQNLIYFGEDFMPRQNSGSVQVFSAQLVQNFKAGALHWDNRLTYQTSTDESVLSLPKFAVYSNLYLRFKIARVLDVQFGIDCDFYTKYYAPNYQPATASFAVQHDQKIGSYPFMNAYLNMKLKKARFYVLFSHVNQGIVGGTGYFSMPHYPLNPRRFLMGVSVDFAN